MDNKTSVSDDNAKMQPNAILSVPKEKLKSIIEAWLVFLAWAERKWSPIVVSNSSKNHKCN